MMDTFDGELFEKIRDVIVISPVTYFGMDLDHNVGQLELLKTGKIENPELIYPLLKSDMFIDELKYLDNLKLEVAKHGHLTIREIYMEKIREKELELRMIHASADEDWEEFMRCNHGLFEYDNAMLFGKLAAYLVEDMKEVIGEENALVKLLAGVVDGSFDTPTIDDAGFVRAELEKEYPFVESLVDMHEYQAKDIKKVFDAALSKLGVKGFKVMVIDSGKSGISVDHNGDRVKIPGDRVVGKKRMKALIVHELITHIKRRLNGAESKLKLLELGLSGYLVGEEGIATVRQQAYTWNKRRVFEYVGVSLFLAAGLCLGLDGVERDFRRVYELMVDYFMYRQKKRGIDVDVEKAAAAAAFSSCARIFRGTSCDKPGVCYLKDMVYMAGNVKIWDMVKRRDDAIAWFGLGKFDPSSSHQVNQLRDLSVID